MRGDDEFAGAFEAEARLDVVEAVGDGEGGGGEHDGVKAVKERLAQDGRDIDGRGLEEDVFGLGERAAPAAALDPIDRVLLAALHEERELGVEFVGAADEVVDLVGLAGDGLELGVELADDVLEADELGAELFEKLLAVGEGEAAVALGEQREEKLRALADASGELDEIGGDDLFFADGDFEIAQEVFDLEVGDRDAEVAGGNVFELVSFVEDDAGGRGQDSGVGSFLGGELDREVGEEEMVVDDDDVALGGLAAHGGDEAALELGALAADAVLGAGVELAPERAGLGKGGEFGAVAGVGFLVPVEQGAELVDLIEAVEDGLAGEVVELFAAEIVLTALHVADLEALLGRADGRGSDAAPAAGDGRRTGRALRTARL